MTKRVLIVVVAVAAPFLAGCPARGGHTPEETFETAKGYIRDGECERIWALYSEEYRNEISGELENHKAIVRDILDKGGPNVAEWAKFVSRQYDTSMEGLLALTPLEMHARHLRCERNEILQLRIVGEVDIRGDRATFQVGKDEKDTLATWRMRKTDDGRWIIQKTTTGHPNQPGDDFRR